MMLRENMEKVKDHRSLSLLKASDIYLVLNECYSGSRVLYASTDAEKSELYFEACVTGYEIAG